MATINDIMTREVSTIQLSDALQTAAQRMRDLNVGVLPVCDGETLVGMVTDRDIAVRGVAAGLNPADALVSDVMTDEVHSCSATDTIDAAMKQMGGAQVRRLAVLDPKRRIVGIVTLGDLATRQSAPTDAALREISESGPTV
ncbi:MAG TPA: CBS domain-containing protein [Burkholderiaceae bacterium]|nr:CBS domain-containing protein [Burkholderiaceae bacterium]